MGSDGYVPLFETKKVKGSVIYKLFAVSIFVGICLIFVYRFSHIPREGEDGRWAWIGLCAAELWFSLFWVCTQALRWNRVYRCTFKDRLSQRSISLSHTQYFAVFTNYPSAKLNFVQYEFADMRLINFLGWIYLSARQTPQ